MSAFLIGVVVECRAKTARQELVSALEKLADDDPDFRFLIDPGSGRTVISGPTETVLKAKIGILEGRYGLAINVGNPEIAYRETIVSKATVDYTHKKQTGGSGQFARVKLTVEPLLRDAGVEFTNEVIGGAIPKEFIPGIERGIESVLPSGVAAGFPVVDVRIVLLDGAYHDIDSSALAFEIAARAALREALQKAQSQILEPIMQLTVRAGPDRVAPIIRDLKLRRTVSVTQDADGSAWMIAGQTPLANLFGYDKALADLSDGGATFEMRFSHYAPVPPPVGGGDDTFSPAIGMRA